MSTKNSKQRRRIQVIDAALVTSVERRWAQAIASWARARVATRCMRASERVPHHTTRLIN